jgi:hypothetical protein
MRLSTIASIASMIVIVGVAWNDETRIWSGVEVVLVDVSDGLPFNDFVAPGPTYHHESV